MGRVFQQAYTKKLKSGETVRRKTLTWYLEYTNHAGAVITVSSGLKDEGLAKQMLARLERQVERIKAGVIEPEEAEGVSKTIAEALKDHVAYLRSTQCTEAYVKLFESRVRRVSAGCGWIMVNSMKGDKLQAYLTQEIEAGQWGAQTANHIITAFRGLANRLLEKRHLQKDPFIELKLYNVDADRKHERRAMSNYSFLRFLLRCAKSPKVLKGFNGLDRAALYLLAATSGLRSMEISELRPADLRLGDDPPHVRQDASKTKNGKEARIPLPAIVAERLKEWAAARSHLERLFPGRWATDHEAAKLVQRDLKMQGLPYAVDGKVFDFHALRGQYGTMLARAGVSIQVTKELMRHSDIKLTLKHYTHLSFDDLSAEVNRTKKDRERP